MNQYQKQPARPCPVCRCKKHSVVTVHRIGAWKPSLGKTYMAVRCAQCGFIPRGECKTFSGAVVNWNKQEVM